MIGFLFKQEMISEVEIVSVGGFLGFCDNEISLLLSRLIEQYAVQKIYQWVYGKFNQNPTNESYGNVEYTKIVSNNGVKEIHHIWTVPNFCDILESAQRFYYSPKPTKRDDCQFQLMVERSYYNSINIYYISPTSVFLNSVRLKTFTFDESNWVYDQNESVIGIQNRQIVNANSWNALKELSIDGSYIKDETMNKILFLKNGTLYLKFEFVVTVEKETEDYKFHIPPPQLSNDMKNLYLEGKYNDVVIISADGLKFKVHKAVLATRSAVLKAHFEHNTIETITNIVESPLESAVLVEVLYFIYTDEAQNVNLTPEKLLAAADYYQLSRLKSICEEVLYKKLTVNNAIEILQLADLHSADTLKQLTLRYIRCDERRLQLITKTIGWSKLKSVDLMKSICG